MSLLSKKIDEYLAKDFSRFHSPAHCGYLSLRDLSEVEGLDDLQNPSGVLNNAQFFVAELFGAQRSFFLLNGASLGMQVSCLALKLYLQETGDKRPVLIARNIHKSTIAGIILAGLDIKWFEPEWDEDLGVYTRFTSSLRGEQSATRNDLDSYSALIVTNPTYEGFYSELPHLDIPIIVDEAHGAHYHFSNQLPKPALECGADIVVQSWHKTLGSMTQTGVLHLSKKSKINPRYIQACLNLLQTTSPSYILLESLSKTAEKYANEGKEIIQRTLDYANSLDRHRICNDDPTRLIIQAPDYSGEELDGILLNNKISSEEILANSVLALINPGNTDKDIKRLQECLKRLETSSTKSYPKIPKPNFAAIQTNMRAAFIDHLDIDIYAPCPPGIPLKVPGQKEV